MSDGITDARRAAPYYDKGTDVMASAINAMISTFKTPGEAKQVLEDFRRENNLALGYQLTPELRKKLAEKFTDHIMNKAKGAGSNGNE